MISLTSPVKTPLHHLPAGVKLACLSISTMGLFWLDSLFGQAMVVLCVLVLYSSQGKRFLWAGLGNIVIIWPFVLLLLVWHVISDDLYAGGIIACRMLSAVALANIVTMTTPLSAMMGVLRWVLTPLRWLGVSTHVVELALGLVIRFVPSLMQKGRLLRESWRVRSRASVGWRIIFPMAILALDDAERVAEALRARGGIMEQQKEE